MAATAEQKRNSIAIIGANGATGRLIVATLASMGYDLLLAGRDVAGLRELATRENLSSATPLVHLTLGSPTAGQILQTILSPPVGIVINCAGPYTLTGLTVARAAVTAGVHYIDLSGEQNHLSHIFSQLHPLAQKNHCVVLPGAGFEFAIGDWLAAAAAEGELLETLTLAYAFATTATSRGTRLSALQVLARGGVARVGGRPFPRRTGTRLRSFSFPHGRFPAVWAPTGEVIMVPRHTSVKNIETYLAFSRPLTLAIRIFSFFYPAFARLTGSLLATTTHTRPIPAQERARSRCYITGEITTTNDLKRTITASGVDVYTLTAMIIACEVKALQARSLSDPGGTLTPAQLINPLTALAYLHENTSLAWEIK